MEIAQIITYLSIFFWLLPPLRQYKEGLFLYFLITALMDPLNLFYVVIMGGHQFIIHSISSVFLFYSINFSLINLKKYWYLNALYIIAVILALVYLSNLLLLIIALHLLIFIKFFKIGIVTLHKFNNINIFQLALIFYEISVVINELVFISNLDIKVVFFYTTLFFQSLIAIFFTIFKEGNPRLNISLKSFPLSSKH